MNAVEGPDVSPSSEDLSVRRGLWRPFGAAALLASLVLFPDRQVAKADKKIKKLKTKKCKRQVDQCEIALDKACQNEPICESHIPCCQFLSDCSADVALACIFAN